MESRDGSGNKQYKSEKKENHSKLTAKFDTVLRADSKNWQAWLGRGKARFALKLYELAAADLAQAGDLNPYNAEISLYQGLVCAAREDYAAAYKYYDKTIDIAKYGKTYEERQFAEAAHVNRGRLYYADNKLNQAQDDFREAILINPYNSFAYIHLGDLYSAQDLDELAISCYTTTINIEPNAKAWHRRGNVYARRGDQISAIEDYTRALQFDEYYTGALHDRAVAHLKSRDTSTAVTDFSALMELSQRNPMAYTGRAYAHYAYKSYGQAYLDATKALTLDPDNAAAYLCRAFAHRAQEDLLRTVNDFREVFKRAKSSHLKIYAILQLLDLSADNDYIPAEKIAMIPLCYELAQKKVKTAEELCVLVMALSVTGEFELAKKACQELLNTFLPDALPHHLQKDFIMLLLNSVYWTAPDCGLFTTDFARLFKTQIISMILNMDDREVLLNAGIQALCPQTALGGMLYVKRGHAQPWLASGSLHKLGAALDYIIMSKSPRNRNVRLDTATQNALREEIARNPAFRKALSHHFPNLYNFVEKYLLEQTAQYASLFYFRKDTTSIQQFIPTEEEGNRFIRDL